MLFYLSLAWNDSARRTHQLLLLKNHLTEQIESKVEGLQQQTILQDAELSPLPPSWQLKSTEHNLSNFKKKKKRFERAKKWNMNHTSFSPSFLCLDLLLFFFHYITHLIVNFKEPTTFLGSFESMVCWIKAKSLSIRTFKYPFS